MDDTFLKVSALASLWAVSERQTRNILATLETLGFRLEIDNHGARQLPLVVATAVKAVRQAGVPLETLRERPDLKPFLRPDAGPVDDPFVDLLELRVELGIVREVLARTLEALRGGSITASFVAPANWTFLGLPDPRRGL